MLILQALIMVIESMHEKTEEAMSKLLQSLFRAFIITIDQMRNVSRAMAQNLSFERSFIEAISKFDGD